MEITYTEEVYEVDKNKYKISLATIYNCLNNSLNMRF